MRLMWTTQILLAAVGLSAGAAVAGGLFAFIVELGVVADFADRTHTADKILFYESCVALGGILGNIFYVFRLDLPAGTWFLALYGILAGIFAGCWAMALAEILNLFPIFIRRAKLQMCIKYIVLGIAMGKTAGAMLFFAQRW